jgi:endonuclease YncB( thermonuclease family)
MGLRRTVGVAGIVAGGILAAAGALGGEGKPTGPPPETAEVVNVYDGDTFTLSTDDRVRLRWVNAPEMRPAEPYAVESREAVSALVLGKQVKLVVGAVPRDAYGRVLAGVVVDGKDLSTELLERGLAHLFVIPPDDTDLSGMVAAQERARGAKRGIWSTPTFQGVLHITSFHANADGDDRENLNGEYLRVCNVSAAPVDLAGFKLTDISGSSWELPSMVVPPGNTVKIMSGRGHNQPDASRQLEVYLQSATPVWNNTRDRATLYDRFGKVVDAREHAPGGGAR